MNRLAISAAALCCVSGAAVAEPQLRTGYSTFGSPGMIEMPSADARPDGELAYTYSYFHNTRRNTLAFQITPRLSAALRYTQLFRDDGDGFFNFDRSLTVQYQFIDESDIWPSVAVGFGDLIGTGKFRSEYVVASKRLTPRLRVTGGIGWGRLAGAGSFSNPLSVFGESFEEREPREGNQGGLLETSQMFQGDAALFGGVEFQATERLSFTAEFSSDQYEEEDGVVFDYESPFNFGVSYQATDTLNIKAHYLYGSEVGVQFTYAFNPKTPPNGSGLEKAPPPVVRRSAAALGWSGQNRVLALSQFDQTVEARLESFGLGLHGVALDGSVARVEIENSTYLSNAQAVGRTGRAMTAVLPPEIDTIVVVPVVNGIRGAEVTLRRDDLESLEFEVDGAWSSYARAGFDSAVETVEPLPNRYPSFDYGLRPYFSTSLFDPDNPFRGDIGLTASARYEPAPGVVIRGAMRQRLIGNLDESDRESDSVLPHVRSDFAEYDRYGDLTVNHLTASYFFKPGKDLYGRLTAGYLERQYAGVSTEVLWKPVDSRLALGAELNYVKKREYDQRFGLRDYEVATGHASVYYDFGNGYHGQLDAGRYLAGDWGATVTLDREFKNGWSIGAFATLTDVPFEDFGEGSFDKGIRLTVPIGWINGSASRDRYSTVIRPLTRDGGARLRVHERLYDTVRDTHQPAMADTWGRFWR